ARPRASPPSPAQSAAALGPSQPANVTALAQQYNIYTSSSRTACQQLQQQSVSGVTNDKLAAAAQECADARSQAWQLTLGLAWPQGTLLDQVQAAADKNRTVVSDLDGVAGIRSTADFNTWITTLNRDDDKYTAAVGTLRSTLNLPPVPGVLP